MRKKGFSTFHPYVTQVHGLCGGVPVIKGRRIPIWVIAWHWRNGTKPEGISKHFQIPLSYVFDALSFYLDHQKEIDAQIKENEGLYRKGKAKGEVRFGGKRGKVLPVAGR